MRKLIIVLCGIAFLVGARKTVGLQAAESIAGECLPARGGWITAGELASAVPEFAVVEPGVQVFGAPRPGVRRILPPNEIVRAANRLGLSIASPASVCFAAPVAHLTAGQVEPVLSEATGRALGAVEAARARIEILDWPRRPLPEGILRTADGWLDSFVARPDGAGIVRMILDLGGGRTLPVRIQARIVIPARRWAAAADLTAGAQLGASDIHEEEVWSYLGWNSDPLGDPVEAAEALIGAVLRQRIAAGTVLRTGMIDRPLQIGRGDLVELHVLSGAARLRLTATAERDGRAGDQIPLHIPGTGRRVLARVTGPGAAALDAQPATVVERSNQR
jgi:flagella basal body P-ring formation protein FlgA